MQIPQALPLRSTAVATDDPLALAAAQPERRREYIRIHAGDFRGALLERSNGAVSVLYERWSCALRVRCARPRSYVAFCVPRGDAPTNWCGIALQPGSILEVARDWEISSRGCLELFSFAVERGRLERAEASLAGGSAEPRPLGNHAIQMPDAAGVANRLRHRLARALASHSFASGALRGLEADLVEIAARLRSGWRAGAEPESGSRRRHAVRRVEEYLEAHAQTQPSLAELCAIAGVSERTLEYAFREQIGVTPGRYLRLRRLNAVRRELRDAEPLSLRVTEVAMRFGFWELGRFASEYRALFGERPSETIASRMRRSAIARASVSRPPPPSAAALDPAASAAQRS